MGQLRRFTGMLWLLLPAAIVAVVVLSWPQPASAQCGSSASSCKNCHEVQGEYPVNSSGDWHVSHAFGDFCEFCHAGNVQATEIEAAHTGIVYPLEDVNASCAGCHPSDTMEKAEVYAVALGVTVGTGSGSGAVTGGDGGAESAVDVEEPAPADAEVEPPAAEVDAPSEAGQGEIVDFNSQYARTVQGERAPLNVGNAILAAMSLGLAALGGVLVWRWEGFGQRWQALRGQPVTTEVSRRATDTPPAAGSAPVASPAARSGAGVQDALDETPQLADVVQNMDATTRQALQRILMDAETGEAMIQALARLDPRLVRVVAQLEDQERDLLMAVVRAMGERPGTGD